MQISPQLLCVFHGFRGRLVNLPVFNVHWMDLFATYNSVVQEHLVLGKDTNRMGTIRYLCVDETAMATLVLTLATALELVRYHIHFRNVRRFCSCD